jgi:6-phosphogluconate dehydrogenase
MVSLLRSKGHTLTCYDPDETVRARAEKELGVTVVAHIEELCATHRHISSKTVWLMVPHSAVEGVLDTLTPHLIKGDVVIDGGNSPYRETMQRSARLHKKGIAYLDAGVSGGPRGALEGACVMVGGDSKVFEAQRALFEDIAARDALLYCGKSGAGHFVKMVHNGIEYGMMQAIAEGFDVLRSSDFKLNLTDIAELFNHKSVIESRLVGWLASGYRKHGDALKGITGTAQASGEGKWTVEAAKELGVPVKVIADALKAREKSKKEPSYQGQVVSVLRNEFGGHVAT